MRTWRVVKDALRLALWLVLVGLFLALWFGTMTPSEHAPCGTACLEDPPEHEWQVP